MYPPLICHFCQFAAASIYCCFSRNSGAKALHAKMHQGHAAGTPDLAVAFFNRVLPLKRALAAATQ